MFLFTKLLKPALKAVDMGSRNPFHILAALIAWPLDVWHAHTSWPTLVGPLQAGEWTISQSLERMCLNENDPNHKMAWEMALKINSIVPSPHIKAVLHA